ncbi:hypothetical protein AAG570_013835 [Ranatra chinensis]|uniref:Uncharacterized protein n=1 Tax=Ranatra chinensis TaxID=642074 RepID=A0ABD0YDL4_9HEMI
MASKRRNMFHKNKTQETTEKDERRPVGGVAEMMGGGEGEGGGLNRVSAEDVREDWRERRGALVNSWYGYGVLAEEEETPPPHSHTNLLSSKGSNRKVMFQTHPLTELILPIRHLNVEYRGPPRLHWFILPKKLSSPALLLDVPLSGTAEDESKLLRPFVYMRRHPQIGVLMAFGEPCNIDLRSLSPSRSGNQMPHPQLFVSRIAAPIAFRLQYCMVYGNKKKEDWEVLPVLRRWQSLRCSRYS